MAAAYDINSDENSDLLINTTDGDFEIAASDKQHIYDIVESFVGWWKEFPSLGVGIKQYQSSSGKEQELEKNIKLQLQGDGYSVDGTKVELGTDGEMQIWTNADRK